MFKRMAGAVAMTLLVACGAENRTGLPETETTGTVQSAQDTSTAWHPQGKKLAFVSTRAGGSDVFVLDVK